jgi:glycerol-3-phosphate dehydrogenase
MAGHERFTVRPRRGELIVFDKLARSLVNHVLLPVPTATTKGVLVAPTVFGNVLLGPTAEDLDDKLATGTSEAGLASLLDHGGRIVPALVDEEITATYAGLRAAIEHADYQIHRDGRYVCVGGIRSTGLTASMAIATEVADHLSEAGLLLVLRADPAPTPTMSNLGESAPRPYQHDGAIVCFCERVTAAEIDAALVAPIPARDIDGLRRRTRAMAGRCQGFFCGAELTHRLKR